MAVKLVPDGYHTLTPYLIMRGADKTVEFLKKAFDAEVSFEHAGLGASETRRVGVDDLTRVDREREGEGEEREGRLHAVHEDLRDVEVQERERREAR